MSSKTINTILNLKDNMSPKLLQTSQKVGNLTKAQQRASKQMANTAKNYHAGFNRMAGSMLRFAAALVVGAGIKDIVASAATAQARLDQMDAVLKSTGSTAGMTKNQLLALADAQGKVTRFSKGTTIEAENMLLTFTNVGSKVFPQTIQAAEDMATAMHTDATSAAKMLGKALNDPAAGLSKLTKQGVTFTKAQKDQIASMQKAGDVVGAQKIILAELDKEFGGSAIAAAKGFDGQLAILKNQAKGLGVSIANGLMPHLTSFITTVNNKMPKIKTVVTGVIDMIVPKFKEWMRLIKEIFKELFPKFGKSIETAKGKTSLFKDILQKVSDVLTFVKDHINLLRAALGILAGAWVIQTTVTAAYNAVLFFTKLRLMGAVVWLGLTKLALLGDAAGLAIATAAQWLFNAAMDANPIGLIILGLYALGGVIYLVVKHWKDIVTWIKKAWEWLTTWNGTKAKDKNATVTTTQKTVFKGTRGVAVGKNALGTSYWRGGLTSINERGGEIVDLPSGSKVIPADKSQKIMNKNNSRNLINININGTGKSTDEMINEFVPKLKLALANM